MIFGVTLRLSSEYVINEETPIELQIFLDKLRGHSSRLSQCIQSKNAIRTTLKTYPNKRSVKFMRQPEVMRLRQYVLHVTPVANQRVISSSQSRSAILLPDISFDSK
ncbi:hypothetical protein HZH66_000935 [Vespula vulgaris]|uniref:Uncharacterized protein n=1 Tax=Vespula vulgaris TaxID=7454 RepID=A0A834NL96_VESVU|nr:hypothetical protein HZH66_000935 [Vespula vulgaris]